jgi:DNA polymerase-1
MSARPDPERAIYLVDGTNNLFRAFYAIRHLSNSKGFPTNAVFGFTAMLRKLLREHAPRYAGVAFDLAEPTFRHRAYADYKANRPEAPPDLVAQIPVVKKVCGILGVASLELPGYEADDLIGTLARRGSEAGFEVVIVATDKDLLQLVGDRVQIFNPTTEQFLDAAGVESAFGVKPSQVRDVLALWGDESDNIPGVPGIGEKGAKELIRRFGDLEAVLAAASTLKSGRQREGLEKHAETARLSRDLATVNVDVPIPFELDRLRLKPPDGKASVELFQELEFTSLAREFAAPAGPRAEALPETHTILGDAASLERVVSRLRSGKILSLHLEGDSPEPMRAALVGIALAGPAGEGFYVPLGHGGLGAPSRMRPDAALRLLRPLLEDPGVERVGDDIKTDLVFLRRLGISVPGFSFDTMIASYLLNPSRRSHSLEAVAEEVTGLNVPAYEAVLGSGAKRVPITEIGEDRAAALVCPRAAAMLALRGRLEAALRDAGLLPLFRDLELPLASVLADMEIAGVRIDAGFLAPLSAEWGEKMVRLTTEIHALAGREFNLNSPRQLGEVLFETLKLRPGRKTLKTGSFSTSVDVLEDLAESHELPRRILEYRTLQKLKSTYVDTLPRLAHPETGRVHTSFNQAVAATGRLSSSDPNLQNIPVRTELGQQIRRAFIPADGCLLLSADYSQIELRILAHLCADPALVSAFRAGEDIHRRTAAEIFGVHPDLVTDEMRRRAKAVNFGILYGMGPQRLARDQGIPLKEAREFIERYFRRLPGVKEYIDGAIAAVEREGSVRTLFGRVRYFPEIRGTDRNARQQAIRAAVNTAIQGTAADLIKMAMVALSARLRSKGSGARMTLQVHDELVLEVPTPEVAPTAAIVRRVMERIHPLAVPLAVDLRVGKNWLDLEDVRESKD